MTSAFLTLTKGQGHTTGSNVTDVEVSAFSCSISDVKRTILSIWFSLLVSKIYVSIILTKAYWKGLSACFIVLTLKSLSVYLGIRNRISWCTYFSLIDFKIIFVRFHEDLTFYEDIGTSFSFHLLILFNDSIICIHSSIISIGVRVVCITFV